MSFIFKERPCIHNQNCLIAVSSFYTFLVHRVESFVFYWKKFLRRVEFYFYRLGPPQSPHVCVLWKEYWTGSLNNCE